MARKKKDAVPFSENEEKQHLEYDEQACINELQRIVRAYPDKVISRNFFRVHSTISESTWTRFFGTFEEFKRQANVTPTRQQHKLEKDIAKHASVAHYRELSVERKNWGSKYVRNNKTRFQTILCASDLHDKECDPFYLSVLVDTAKRLKPDVIALVGDVFDLPEFGKYTVDPRSWDVTGRIEFVHNSILKPLRKAAPNAQIDFIEGNHEARLIRHLADATPALRAVLSDLHGFTIPKLLGLEQFEVNYIAKADLGAFTMADDRREIKENYKVYFDCFAAHHFPQGKELGVAGVNGHHHRTVMQTLFNHRMGSYNWLQMGAGHILDAEYCEAQKWQNSFAVAHIDTHKSKVLIEPIVIEDTFACVGGKYYYKDGVE